MVQPEEKNRDMFTISSLELPGRWVSWSDKPRPQTKVLKTFHVAYCALLLPERERETLKAMGGRKAFRASHWGAGVFLGRPQH
jgi:hypothetical protein